jgi:hypothetical protein
VHDGAVLNLVLQPASTSTPLTTTAPAAAAATATTAAASSSSRTLQACYLSSLPRVTELHPSVGLTSGGQRVLIAGANFSRNCTCRFGPVRNLPLKYHRQV